MIEFKFECLITTISHNIIETKKEVFSWKAHSIIEAGNMFSDYLVQIYSINYTILDFGIDGDDLYILYDDGEELFLDKINCLNIS